MGYAFHQLCLRYSGALTPTAPTAIRLWETLTFTLARDRRLNKVAGLYFFVIKRLLHVTLYFKAKLNNIVAGPRSAVGRAPDS